MSVPAAPPPSSAAKIEPTGRSSAVAVAVDLTPVCSRRLEDLDGEEAVALERRLNSVSWGEFAAFLVIGVLTIAFIRAEHSLVLFGTALSGVIVTKLLGNASLKRVLRDEFLLDDDSIRALRGINEDESDDTVLQRAIRRRDRFAVSEKSMKRLRGLRIEMRAREQPRDDTRSE